MSTGDICSWFNTRSFADYGPAKVLLMALLLAGALGVATEVAAGDYRARTTGEWHNAKTWQPRGVPAQGDRVISLGQHTVTVTKDAAIGAGAAAPVAAIVLDGTGSLIIGQGAVLTLHGHLALIAESAELELQERARLEFAPRAGQVFELQLFASKQRVKFSGAEGARSAIALAAGSGGHWFVASKGHRDSVLAGSYGLICDALEPASGKAWSMYLANDKLSSRLAARYIEFRNSGQVGVFGLDAGEHTYVDITGWTFRDSHPVAKGLPSLWFDGYGDVVVEVPANKARKRIRDLVSDKEVYVRYVQGFTLERWVLGANGKPGNVRAGNNGGNALSQTQLFQVIRDSGGVGLLADLTESAYLYAEADNPHGFDTRHLRGDATLRNFWFESSFADQSDTGDAILTNGPQGWVSEHGGTPVTLTVEHSGSIGDTSAKPLHPVFLTVNNGVGMRFRLRNNFVRQPVRFNAVALDENGETATGTGLEFVRNLIYSPAPVKGHVLGSAAGAKVKQPDVFQNVDHNLYFNVTPHSKYPRSLHALSLSSAADTHSRTLNPQLLDATRSLASWDAWLDGPGTAAHAIEEMQKLNDDAGFDPRYQVTGLIAYVAAGYAPQHPELLDEAGAPIVGPAFSRSKRW